jgi:polysaccharide export outer membrane protein
MKKKMNFLNKLGFTLILMTFVISCVPAKKLSYFNDIADLKDPLANPKIQKVIMPFDRLYIRVLSIDPQTSQIFNFSEDSRYDLSGSIVGYLVNEAGDVNFPFVGNINVSNLTTAQAATKIQTSLNEYVPNTSVVVKLIDNKISVLGEVNRQGSYSFSQEKINIYEALSLGGGLTRYGNRKNVILIRQEGDKIMHHKLDLSDSKIASKDFYYVLPNDVIVVEPLKSISTNYQNNTVSTLLSAVTTLVAVLALYLRY